MNHFKKNKQLPEIFLLEVQEEIKNFSVSFNRLLLSFTNIDAEASYEAEKYLEKRCREFNPEIDDEGIIYENAYFKEVNYAYSQYESKQNFLNTSVVSLFHIFERQFKKVFEPTTQGWLDIMKKASYFNTDYNVEICPNFEIINKELRLLANAIKHGQHSNAFKKLKKEYPNFINEHDCIQVCKEDIEKYINSIQYFWSNAINIVK